jgi:hypothetical protein
LEPNPGYIPSPGKNWILIFLCSVKPTRFQAHGFGIFLAREGPGLEPMLQGSGTNPVSPRSGGGVRRRAILPVAGDLYPLASFSLVGSLLFRLDMLSASLLFGVG